jgi:internalin A
MPAKLMKNIIVICLVLVFLPATSIWAASVITDPALAKAVRAELELPAKKELKAVDLKKLESLYPSESKAKITSLQGLEYAVNMESLFLPGQKIKNIKPLSKLKKLTFLAVEENQITDLSPISGLSSLEKLVVDGNMIKSLVPLKNLNKLTDLLASNNQVEDLSPIKKLKLEWLLLSGNKIQDLTPLKNHPTLEHLYLDDNLIQDIEVLETLPQLQEVSLANNPLNEQAEQVIQELENNGVIVNLEDNGDTQPE